MLPSKLPPGHVVCDQCGAAEVTLTSTTWDALWVEVKRADWMMVGRGKGSWRLLCPRCCPHGDPSALGPRGGAGG